MAERDPVGASPVSSGAPGIDLASLVSATSGTIKQLQASSADAAAARRESDASARQAQTGIQEQADATIQVDSILSGAAALRQAKDKEIATQWGTNPDAENFILGKLGDEIRGRQADYSSRMDMIARKASVSILDDPLQWFVNSITLPQDQYAAEVAGEVLSKKEAYATDLLSKNTQIDQSNAIIYQADALQVAAAKAKVNLAIAKENVGKVGMEAAKADLSAISISQASTVEQHNALIKLTSAQAAQQELVLKTKQLSLSQEEFENLKSQQTRQFNLELDKYNLSQSEFENLKQFQGNELADRLRSYNLSVDQFNNLKAQEVITNAAQERRLSVEENQLALNKRQQEINEEHTGLINLALRRDQGAIKLIQDKLDNFTRVMGMPPIPYQEYIRMSPEQRNNVDLGMNRAAVHDDGMIAYDPATAYDIATNTPGFVGTPGNQQVMKVLTSIRAATVAHNQTYWSTLKPEEQRSLFLIAIREHNNPQLNGGISLKDDLYSPLSLSATLGISSLSKSTPLAQQLQVLAERDRSYPMDPNLVATEALKLVSDGKMSFTDASQNIALLYQEMMSKLNETRQYQKFSLPLLSTTTTGYRMSADIGGYGLPSQTIDWSKPVQIEGYLRRAQMSQQIQMSPLFGGP